ncbi:hypothetical protein F66182_7234 [Fusarium sp. NRRL 66182]|nr:hypothetical protein F66182_7234 [Fusarium sp. NRRL 66182]
MADQSRSMGELPPTPIRLYTPAVDFIENRLPDYHEAFDPSLVRYDPGRSQFVALYPSVQSQSLMIPDVAISHQARPTPGPAGDMRFWDQIFPDAMKRLNEAPAIQYRGYPQWDIRTLSKWDHVQAKLQKARQVYDFEENSPQRVGRIRRKMRDVMDTHQATVQQAIKVIPNGDMASPITGAITLMLDVRASYGRRCSCHANGNAKAYKQASEVREEVKSAFEDLPDLFAKTDFYLHSYPKDANIIEASVNLVLAVFKAIENSIKFYTSTQAKRAGVAVLTGPQYQKALVESLTEIQNCCKSLESQAGMSFDHRMLGDNDRLLSGQSRIEQGNTMTHYGLVALAQQQTAGVMWMQNMFNQMLSMLNDRERNWQLRTPSPARPLTPQPIELIHWTPRELWSWLRVTNFDEVDLRYVSSQAEQMLHEDRGRAQQLIGTLEFQKWMSDSSSSKLLVHGDFRTERDVSPFSVLCTVLTQAFRTSGHFISLVYFCGHHLGWDEYQGGSAMIRSLIAQLLRQFPGQHIQPHPQIRAQDIERGSLDHLCMLFTHLAAQVPRKTPVVCLIDGLNLYEAQDFIDDMGRVVLSLIDLVHETKGRPVSPFKLLLTSPQYTVEVRKIFDQDPDPNVLLHMGGLPLTETGVELGGLQAEVALGI